MDYNQIFIIFLFVVLLVLSIGVIAILHISKKLLITYQNTDVDIVKRKVTEKLKETDYSLKEKNKKIHVEAGHFKAINLSFKQIDNDVEVFWEISQSLAGGVFLIVAVLTFGIALILSQFADLKSKKLKEETYQLLKDLK